MVCPKPDPALPSSDSAVSYVRGEPGSTGRLVLHTVGRAALIGVGLAAVGQRDHLIRNAFGASIAIESFVLLWAHHAVQKADVAPTATQGALSDWADYRL